MIGFISHIYSNKKIYAMLMYKTDNVLAIHCGAHKNHQLVMAVD